MKLLSGVILYDFYFRQLIVALCVPI